jgi:hypothetical protein
VYHATCTNGACTGPAHSANVRKCTAATAQRKLQSLCQLFNCFVLPALEDAWPKATENWLSLCSSQGSVSAFLRKQGGLNFDLMRPRSKLDSCATLATMLDRDVGGLLSGRPAIGGGGGRKAGAGGTAAAVAVRGMPDKMISMPAMM